jgi:hypothetical protein
MNALINHLPATPDQSRLDQRSKVGHDGPSENAESWSRRANKCPLRVLSFSLSYINGMYTVKTFQDSRRRLGIILPVKSSGLRGQRSSEPINDEHTKHDK